MILGCRRFSNYWWATVILLGGISFILAGFSSYTDLRILPFNELSKISFVPQGVIMVFYGTLATLLSLFLWLTIIWNIGAGYNEFNNEEGIVTIFRLGFPGKNRSLLLQYSTQDIQAIQVKTKEGLASKKEIYLKIKDNRKIPLTCASQPILLSDLEDRAATLAKFLGVVLESAE